MKSFCLYVLCMVLLGVPAVAPAQSRCGAPSPEDIEGPFYKAGEGGRRASYDFVL